MIYLTGSTISNTPKNIGFMATPANGAGLVYLGHLWAADNGAFTGAFEEVKYFAFLEKLIQYQDTCLFATCPDVLCDPVETLKLWERYNQRIMELGYKVAFVCQDGMEDLELPECDAIFIGGSTDWKMSNGAGACIAEAKRRRLWVHVGRVNSRRRVRHFRLMGVDSVDGNFIGFGPDINTPKIVRWMKERMLFDDLYNFVSCGNSCR